jgi:hypothetical protein
LDCSICREFGIEVPDNWYLYVPKPVRERRYVGIIEPRCTNREGLANRPDIIIKNKKEKICTLTDISVPSDRNATRKEAEKKLKYINLCNVEH